MHGTFVDEMIVDSFAGGGGASCGIEMALGRSPDIAINHDPEALAMHAANHPATLHLCRNVYQVDPLDAVRNRPVGLLWASPDCKHHSKAKGGRPVKRSIRDLAWVVVLWARRARPRVIILENVEEFREWGPLVQKCDDAGVPVVDAQGAPVMLPDPARKGQIFEQWVAALRRLGYRIEWRELRACDYGAPTIRKRLFVIGRRDGLPIVWPEPTHGAPDSGPVIEGQLKPWRSAAGLIDWLLPCPSIFYTRDEARGFRQETGIQINRPLAPNTLERIAKGLQRYVFDCADPFLVPASAAGGAANKVDLVAAFLAQHNSGMVGHDARKPVSTICGRGTNQAVVSAGLLNLKGSERRGSPITAPVPAVTAQGGHLAEVRAFLIKYFGEGGQWQDCRDPLHTVTTRDRMGLVVVRGEPYRIVDIGMRMLTARERFNAQGFASDYDIDIEIGGKPITGEAQGRMVGNSVSPPVAAALVRANYVPTSTVCRPMAPLALPGLEAAE